MVLGGHGVRDRLVFEAEERPVSSSTYRSACTGLLA